MRFDQVQEHDAERPRWALWHHQFDLLRYDGTMYLRRWWMIATPWFGVALHKMTNGDAREIVHDHPFAFLSIILRGGYVERRLNPRTMAIVEEHRVRWLNRVRTHDAHSITRLLRVPTWTLLLVGRTRRTWGFWSPLWKYSEGNPSHSWQGWWWVPHGEFDSGHHAAVKAERPGTHRQRPDIEPPVIRESGPTSDGFDLGCPRCNYDTHRCRGCGAPLSHNQDVKVGACPSCQMEIERETKRGPAKPEAAQSLAWPPVD